MHFARWGQGILSFLGNMINVTEISSIGYSRITHCHIVSWSWRLVTIQLIEIKANPFCIISKDMLDQNKTFHYQFNYQEEPQHKGESVLSGEATLIFPFLAPYKWESTIGEEIYRCFYGS